MEISCVRNNFQIYFKKLGSGSGSHKKGVASSGMKHFGFSTLNFCLLLKKEHAAYSADCYKRLNVTNGRILQKAGYSACTTLSLVVCRRTSCARRPRSNASCSESWSRSGIGWWAGLSTCSHPSLLPPPPPPPSPPPPPRPCMSWRVSVSGSPSSPSEQISTLWRVGTLPATCPPASTRCRCVLHNTGKYRTVVPHGPIPVPTDYRLPVPITTVMKTCLSKPIHKFLEMFCLGK